MRLFYRGIKALWNSVTLCKTNSNLHKILK